MFLVFGSFNDLMVSLFIPLSLGYRQIILSYESTFLGQRSGFDDKHFTLPRIDNYGL